MTLEQVTAIATVINGSIAAYIAYQQHKLNSRLGALQEARYVHELFDRRFEVFRATQELLSSGVTDAACSLEQIQKFTNKAQQGYFIFDDSIYQYLMEIRKNAVTLAVLGKARNETIDPQQRLEYSKKCDEALGYLIDQLSESGLFEKFKSYLRPAYRAG